MKLEEGLLHALDQIIGWIDARIPIRHVTCLLNERMDARLQDAGWNMRNARMNAGEIHKQHLPACAVSLKGLWIVE